MNIETELKPCPFCGSINQRVVRSLGDCSGMSWIHIKCLGCGATAPSKQFWNRRHTLESKQPQGEICSKNVCDYCDQENCHLCNTGDEIEYAATGFKGRKLFTGEKC